MRKGCIILGKMELLITYSIKGFTTKINRGIDIHNYDFCHSLVVLMYVIVSSS